MRGEGVTSSPVRKWPSQSKPECGIWVNTSAGNTYRWRLQRIIIITYHQAAVSIKWVATPPLPLVQIEAITSWAGAGTTGTPPHYWGEYSVEPLGKTALNFCRRTGLELVPFVFTKWVGNSHPLKCLQVNAHSISNSREPSRCTIRTPSAMNVPAEYYWVVRSLKYLLISEISQFANAPYCVIIATRHARKGKAKGQWKCQC